MKNLVKCHFYYLINKNTLCIFIITSIIIMISYVMGATFDDYSSNQEMINQYFNTVFFTTKIIGSFIAVFMFASSIYNKNDAYAAFILTANISRHKYFLTKVGLCLMIMISYLCFLFICFLFIGFIFQSTFYMQRQFIKGFIILAFLISIYGLYSMLLMQIIQNLFVIIIPFALIIVSSNLVENNTFTLFLFLFPSNLPDLITLPYGIGHLCLLLLIISLINTIIYNGKDLQY